MFHHVKWVLLTKYKMLLIWVLNNYWVILHTVWLLRQLKKLRMHAYYAYQGSVVKRTFIIVF
jgi:hypothetical protein